MRSCSATRPAHVPRFVTARAIQNEKKRPPAGPTMVRRRVASADCIAVHRTRRSAQPAVFERGKRPPRHDILSAMSVILDGESLTLDEIVRVARGDERVDVAPSALDRVQAARDVVERSVARADGVYGVTTGVGVRKRVGVVAGEMDAYNRRLLRDHRMAAGPDAPREVVRAAMLRLANGFAKGTSGVRRELLGRVVDALNADECPRVRLLGS